MYQIKRGKQSLHHHIDLHFWAVDPTGEHGVVFGSRDAAKDYIAGMMKWINSQAPTEGEITIEEVKV